MLTEFGGIALSQNKDGTWGYSRSDTSSDLLDRYRRLLEAVRGLPALAGFLLHAIHRHLSGSERLTFHGSTPEGSFRRDCARNERRIAGPRSDEGICLA